MGKKSNKNKTIESLFDQYVQKFNKAIYDEMAQAYEDVFNEFVTVWSQWKKSKDASNTNPSKFFMQASSAYWLNDDADVSNSLGDSSDIVLSIDPKNIKTKIYSNWGENYGQPYDRSAAFEMMYYHGIMGYSRDIVRKKWYKTKESQKKYYKRYHLKYPVNREKILKNIFEADIIPPVAKVKPYKNMEKKMKDIQNQKHLDEKWKEISKDLDQQIDKMINK